MSQVVVIVDTNVVVSGLLTRDPASPPASILDAMLDGSLQRAKVIRARNGGAG